MTFRCHCCHAVVWIPVSREAEGHGRCNCCGQAFDLAKHGRPSNKVVVEARQLAFANGIDLPAAYSVALGLMTVDDVRSRLTASVRAEAARRASTGKPVRAVRLPFIVLSGIVASALCLGWLGTRSRSVEGASSAASSSVIGSAEVWTDPRGRVVRVTAPDPRSVLAAFCRAGTEPGRYRVVDLVPSRLEPGRERIGLLEDPGGVAGTLALTIREDRAAARWVAGDGMAPLLPERAPAWAVERR